MCGRCRLTESACSPNSSKDPLVCYLDLLQCIRLRSSSLRHMQPNAPTDGVGKGSGPQWGASSADRQVARDRDVSVDSGLELREAEARSAVHLEM